MIKSLFNVVMDSDQNPLRALPKMVRFQCMVVLSYMWSVIFAMYIGAIALIGPSIAVHTILLIGIFFTAEIFRRSRRSVLKTDVNSTRSGLLSYDMQFKDPADGGAMYDDVWGGGPDSLSRQPIRQS
ncbi:MAG: hypothetical protein OEU92_11170 [Alphaproteobacteria bacterium]|nr:hypothetical protein [Alphaproteobacteria bacterium]